MPLLPWRNRAPRLLPAPIEILDPRAFVLYDRNRDARPVGPPRARFRGTCSCLVWGPCTLPPAIQSRPGSADPIMYFCRECGVKMHHLQGP